MKLLNIFFFSWIFWLNTGLLWAQDTLEMRRFNDGARSYVLNGKKESLLVYEYAGGRRESQRTIRGGINEGTYTRWYTNGKLMWEKELHQGKVKGKCVFYGKNGKRLAELMMEGDSIKRIIYTAPGARLVLGKITSSSKVYGGMQREDGTSNISQWEGPYMFAKMYAVKNEAEGKPVKLSDFSTDDMGEFMLEVPEGRIHFFPSAVPLSQIVPGSAEIPEKPSMSGHSGWTTYRAPEVKGAQQIYQVRMHHSSVGYAP